MGRNALFYSAFNANTDAIELLMASGAKLNRVDGYYRTALHYACMKDEPKNIEAIVVGFRTSGEFLEVVNENKYPDMYNITFKLIARFTGEQKTKEIKTEED